MITVSTSINAAAIHVWNCWNTPKHITQWYHASLDWHAPFAENDLRIGGKFKITMAAKDGSFSFDFEGTYINVIENKLIEYILADNRSVKIEFVQADTNIKIIESFDPETENTIALQQNGWQAILDNFKKYTESIK